MAHGLLVALLVTVAWVTLQNLLMHLRPAENRFRAMAWGYALSVPFVVLGYGWLPPLTAAVREASGGEAWALGLVHACLFHLLLFFLYGECFYYVERSVSLRLFVELLRHGDRGATLSELQARYSAEDMIRRRLDVMRDRGFLEPHGNAWRLRPNGRALARAAIAVAGLFRFKGQHERA